MENDTKANHYAEVKRRAAEELEIELAAWRKLYDQFGEAHIRRMAKDGVNSTAENIWEQ